ncbi:urea amidolyase, partial [Pseudomonas syringae pv. tagetis]
MQNNQALGTELLRDAVGQNAGKDSNEPTPTPVLKGHQHTPIIIQNGHDDKPLVAPHTGDNHLLLEIDAPQL